MIRALLLTAAVVTLVDLTSTPALAAFTDTAAMPPATIGTGAVAAPTDVSTAGTACVEHTDSTGATYTTLEARLSWSPSPTAGISGYELRAYGPGWSYPVAGVDSATTVVTGSFDSAYAGQGIQVTVTARTSYGWTAESQRSAVLSC